MDPTFIPRTSYGHSQDPLIEYDEFREDLLEHLRSVGKYATATSVIQYTVKPDVQALWGLTKPISKTTAQKWLKSLDYCWHHARKGLYLDGHERPDVVEYRQNTYLRKWKEMDPRMQSYARFEFEYTYMDPIIRRIVVWYHDECTFAAHYKRLLLWILLSASPEPTKKGEGRTLMVSDLISAEYGWLQSPDGKDRAREFFRAGAGREGYFSTENVCSQMAHVADILNENYTGADHVIVVDNSPTHKKREADAPSAQRMPKYMPKKEKGAKNFLVRTTDENGNEIEVPMTGGYFSDGTPQSFYWPEDHPRAGWFKGMAEILKERGWENAYKINAKCTRCDKTRTDCCLRRILYNEPDFANPISIVERLVTSRGIGFLLLPKFHPELHPIEMCWGKAKQPDFANPISIVERLVTSRGIGFLLLPKFHPELNPIEMCWGKAKRTYSEFPEPKGDNQLQKYVEAALDSVSLDDIRKFCTHTRRICDGYMKGLDGRLSIWAAKKYHGHRVYPRTIMEEMEQLSERGKNGPKGVKACL
ncbi:hypothetical protein RSAG8_05681, partial [Rhizoctonia solani AG-8 WAC10335]